MYVLLLGLIVVVVNDMSDLNIKTFTGNSHSSPPDESITPQVGEYLGSQKHC